MSSEGSSRWLGHLSPERGQKEQNAVDSSMIPIFGTALPAGYDVTSFSAARSHDGSGVRQRSLTQPESIVEALRRESLQQYMYGLNDICNRGRVTLKTSKDKETTKAIYASIMGDYYNVRDKMVAHDSETLTNHISQFPEKEAAELLSYWELTKHHYEGVLRGYDDVFLRAVTTAVSAITYRKPQHSQHVQGSDAGAAAAPERRAGWPSREK